jgi:hypothetical protein
MVPKRTTLSSIDLQASIPDVHLLVEHTADAVLRTSTSVYLVISLLFSKEDVDGSC